MNNWYGDYRRQYDEWINSETYKQIGALAEAVNYYRCCFNLNGQEYVFLHGRNEHVGTGFMIFDDGGYLDEEEFGFDNSPHEEFEKMFQFKYWIINKLPVSWESHSLQYKIYFTNDEFETHKRFKSYSRVFHTDRTKLIPVKTTEDEDYIPQIGIKMKSVCYGTKSCFKSIDELYDNMKENISLPIILAICDGDKDKCMGLTFEYIEEK